MADRKTISKVIQEFANVYLKYQNLLSEIKGITTKYSKLNSFFEKNAENSAMKAINNLKPPSDQKELVGQYQSKLLPLLQTLDKEIGISKSVNMNVNEIAETLVEQGRELLELKTVGSLLKKKGWDLGSAIDFYSDDTEIQNLSKIIGSLPEFPTDKETSELFAALKAVDQKFGEGDAKLAA